MAPTSSVELAPPILMQRGISGLKYLERFGGYGRQRELGLLQHQVMTVFDFLMEAAARDALALLAAAIEQSCLDGGAHGPCNAAHTAGGPAQFHISESPALQHQQVQEFCAAGGSAVGDLLPGLPGKRWR